ncbi:unnamed protein product [Knipowitschia caucasica]
MEELCDFLRSRHVSEETILQMEQEKIDQSAIKLMSDEELQQYLPSYGDRVAVFGYCRRQEQDPSSRRSKLFERLKGKMKKNIKEHVDAKQQQGRSNNRKESRKIELGWLNYREKEQSFVQIRTKKGGGTRKESVPKTSKKKDLIEKALQLFFPEGENAEGNISDFETDLTDFQEHTLPDDVTVEDLYERTKLPVLRFYLKTKKKQTQTGMDLEDQSTGSEMIIHANMQPQPTNTSDVIYVDSREENAGEQEQTVNLIDLEDSGIVTFRNDGSLETEHQVHLDDTLPLNEDESLPSVLNIPESVKFIVAVHRGQVLKELIQVFADEDVINKDIRFKVILPDGKLEKAFDDGGVLRDVLSEFWNDFYEQCTMGTDFKVPFIRHDFRNKEWESVGRILAFGWKKEKYLPVRLAPVILEQAILGVVQSDLLNTFLKYLPQSERVMFQSCCSDFANVDLEELVEVLDMHNCRRQPTEDNIQQILLELAHQKLIQEPAFIIEQWKNVLHGMKSELKGISAAYDTLLPTSRKIINSLTYPTDPKATEKQIMKYVSAYLRECDPVRLSSFLRFCTGSDVFTGKNITVSFTEIKGFQRRPVAHTCGCYLELSVAYDSYPDFRYEMNCVLESNIWVMDIA